MSKLQVFRCNEIVRNDLPIFKDNVERYILGKVSGGFVDFVVLGNITNGEINLDGLHIRRTHHWDEVIDLSNNTQIPISLKYKSGKVDRNNKFMISIPELSLIYIYSPKLNGGNVIQINTKVGSIEHIEFDLFERIKDGNIIKKNVEIVSNRKVKNKKVMSG